MTEARKYIVERVIQDIQRLYATDCKYKAGIMACALMSDAYLWFNNGELTAEEYQKIEAGCRTCWGEENPNEPS